MESYPQPEEKCSGQPSDEFEAIVYRKVGVTSPSKCWQCQLFRPPPYVNDPTYWKARSGISSYAAIDGGSLICISVKGIGTYCLETASYTWSKVGDWTLPFYGKVEYVPELKLWFGLSADGHQLAAADLSDLDSQPQIVGAWKELNSPCEWKERRNAQLVNLGFGMFCIARFLGITEMDEESHELLEQNFIVFTGVEVGPCVHDGNANSSSSRTGSGNYGKVKLKMTPHISRCHMPINGTNIKTVF
ncbi:hypothetical protein PR202_gb21649 [Eleusine coracana subsp. coracana]|uniref:Uncharacterized protein n=1 Tax=Eleusine coracana subsp. coracana TaxID=191504 RepID=A0AAV5FDP7_ELECO|nr:hypothetical protein PR202_gb21649 [Eleusine coracana subsp. coracana]